MQYPIYVVVSPVNCCNSFSRYRARLAADAGRSQMNHRASLKYQTGKSQTWICPCLRLAGLVLQRCSPAKLTVPLLMEALDSAWCDSWRPLTNLTCKFRACHLYTFNVAAIFSGSFLHMAYYRTPWYSMKISIRLTSVVLAHARPKYTWREPTFSRNYACLQWDSMISTRTLTTFTSIWKS